MKEYTNRKVVLMSSITITNLICESSPSDTCSHFHDSYCLLTQLANTCNVRIDKPQVILLSSQRLSHTGMSILFQVHECPLSLPQIAMLTQEILPTPSAFSSLRIPPDPELIPSAYPKPLLGL